MEVDSFSNRNSMSISLLKNLKVSHCDQRLWIFHRSKFTNFPMGITQNFYDTFRKTSIIKSYIHEFKRGYLLYNAPFIVRVSSSIINFISIKRANLEIYGSFPIWICIQCIIKCRIWLSTKLDKRNNQSIWHKRIFKRIIFNTTLLLVIKFK